jgi:hypothetical protein
MVYILGLGYLLSSLVSRRCLVPLLLLRLGSEDWIQHSKKDSGTHNMGALPPDIEKFSDEPIAATDRASDEEKPLDWNDPREKRNPKNWSMSKRIYHTTLPSFLAFEM